jgi:anti-anti-sigma factor
VPVQLKDVDDGSGPVVHVSGALDHGHASEFQNVMEAAIAGGDAKAVTVDLSDCTQLPEHGLSVLLAARSFCERKFVDLVLVQGPAQVQRKFAMTGTGRIFRFSDT